MDGSPHPPALSSEVEVGTGAGVGSPHPPALSSEVEAGTGAGVGSPQPPSDVAVSTGAEVRAGD